MMFDEAARLLFELARDTSTRLFASLSGWSQPLSTIDLLVMDFIELTAHANGHKTWRHPRRPVIPKRRLGNSDGLTRGQAAEILRRMRHGELDGR